MSTIDEELTYLEETKQQIKQAIIDKGQEISENDSFRSYVDKIEAIESGGTPVSIEEKDVNFYDYDGTRLYSYTLTEVQNLTELPALPSHTGLTCQGWNWTLADIKAEGKATDVGAMYITDDGKTRLHIKIAAEGRMTVPLCFLQSVANGVEVDWGDGSTIETFTGSGNTNILPTHTYSAIGNYVITLNPLNNCILKLGGFNNNTVLANTFQVYKNMLYKVELGKNTTEIIENTFNSCKRLETISIPSSITTIASNSFRDCAGLLSVIIPQNVTNTGFPFGSCTRLKYAVLPKNLSILGDGTFYGDYALVNITIPKSMTSISANLCYSCIGLTKIKLHNVLTSIGDSAFSNCSSLSEVTIPNSVTTIGSSAFSNCITLMKVIISENLTIISSNIFSSCSSLSSLIIPPKVNTIQASAFNSCSSMAFYDFSSHTNIPSLANTNAFRNIPSACKIIVPDSLYETWIGTTNWSTYASKIIKKSDWDAL